jgi:ELWxxDGT repeat protein
MFSKLKRTVGAVALAFVLTFNGVAPAFAGTTWTFNPGTNGSNITESVTLGTTLYFVADDGLGMGGQLWKTDGSTAGTAKVAGQGLISNVHDLITINGALSFVGTTAASGEEIYFTDASASNLYVGEVRSGANGSAPSQLVALGTSLAFSADPDGTGQRLMLWKSGAADPETIIANLPVGNEPTQIKNPYGLTVSNLVNNTVPSSTTLQLYVGGTHGSDAKRSLFSITNNNSVATQFAAFNVGRQIDPVNLAAPKACGVAPCGNFGGLIFSGADANGREPWYINGWSSYATLPFPTTPTAARLVDVNPGAGSSDPAEFVYTGQNYVFSALPSGTVRRTFTISGSTLTQLGSVAENPSNFFADGSDIYFSAGTATQGVELWKSTSNGAGTTALLLNYGDEGVPPNSGFPYGLVRQGNRILLGAQRIALSVPSLNVGFELYSFLPGTPSTQDRVADINTGSDPSLPIMLKAVGTTQFFSAYTNASGYELYKAVSSGSNAMPTVSLVANINATPRQQAQTEAISFVNGANTYTVFGASDSAYGSEPRVSVNGSNPTTTPPLKDILPGGFGSDPRGFTVGGTAPNQLGYFTADDGTGRQLWQTNGTAAGTVKVALPTTGLGTGFVADSQVVAKPNSAIAYFVGYSSTGTHLMKVNGGTATLAYTGPIGSMLTEVANGPGDSILMSGPVDTATIDKYRLLSYPGTGTAVATVGNIEFPYEITTDAANNVAYAFGSTAALGYEPYKISGTTATLIKDVNPGTSGSNPTQGIMANGRFYFAAYSNCSSNEPDDGTSEYFYCAGSPRLRIWKTSANGATAYSDVTDDVQGGVTVAKGGAPEPGSYTDYQSLISVKTGASDVVFYPSQKLNINPQVPVDPAVGDILSCSAYVPLNTKTRLIYSLPPKSVQSSFRFPGLGGGLAQSPPGNPDWTYRQVGLTPQFTLDKGFGGRIDGSALSRKSLLFSNGQLPGQIIGTCLDSFPPNAPVLNHIDTSCEGGACYYYQFASNGQVFDYYDSALFADEVKMATVNGHLYIAIEKSNSVKVLKYDVAQSLTADVDGQGLGEYRAFTTVFPAQSGLTIDQVTLTPTGNKMFLNYIEGGNFKMNDVTN